MLSALLEIIPKDGNYYFDNFGEALVYALIGFVVVFLGITLIICIIWLLGFILRKTNNLEFLSKVGKKKKVSEKNVEIAESVDDGEIPDEVKAAIVAAIMAYYSEAKPECEFRVRRIKSIKRI